MRSVGSACGAQVRPRGRRHTGLSSRAVGAVREPRNDAAETPNHGTEPQYRGPHVAVRIGVPKETDTREQRVAVVPDGVRALVRSGATVVVERGAGARAYYGDALYETAGATLAGDPAAIYDTDVVVKVQRPTPDEIARLRRGTLLISLMAPATHPETVRALLDAGVTALALELVPRITRAQSMDVLSSQSTVAGYKA